MREELKGTFRFLWSYKRILGAVSLAFVVAGIMGVFAFNSDPDYAKELAEMLETMASGFADQEGFALALSIFLNNLKASALGVVFGIIPFIFIPAFIVFSNGMTTGSALAYAALGSGRSIMELLLVGIMPHGVFELPALMVSITIGIIMCKELTFALLRKPHLKLIEMFNQIARVYIVIVVPLLVLAAMVETFITPLLLY